jgi:hypothetical protein
MKLADIKERADQVPFRPFALETIGGSWIQVEEPSDIMLNPRRPDLVVVFNENGRMYILGVEQIASVEGK